MPVSESDYINVRDKAIEFGFDVPDGLVFLPTNFDQAEVASDLRQSVEAVTVKKLFVSKNLDSNDLSPVSQGLPYTVNNSVEWIGPLIFISSTLLSDNPDIIELAVDT